jgi:general secretion pathway protein K
MNPRQSGMALISVLLIMSLALLIIGGLLRTQRLLLQGSAQQLHQLQLRQFGLAGERWALSVLQDPAMSPQKTVDLTQGWARAVPEFGTEDAQWQIEIEDMAGRFNLNSLLRMGQIDQVTLGRWARLLTLLDLPALQLIQVGELRELSQLRLLPGIDARVLQQLEPWVALLPAEAVLNVNTAPEQVLRTLNGVDATMAAALVRQRAETGWKQVQAFTQDPLLSGAEVNGHGLGVNSRWYRITVQVIQGQGVLRLTTDVERDPDTHQLKILQRRLLPSIAHERLP